MDLIATAVGFYKGRRVRVGESFEFDDSELVQAREGGKRVFKDGQPVMVNASPPKWAAPAAAASKVIAEDHKRAHDSTGDTKPVEAQRAVRRKAGQLAGTDLA